MQPTKAGNITGGGAASLLLKQYRKSNSYATLVPSRYFVHSRRLSSRAPLTESLEQANATRDETSTGLFLAARGRSWEFSRSFTPG